MTQEEIDKFSEQLRSYTILVESPNDDFEFMTIAKVIMWNLNVQFKLLEIEARKTYGENYVSNDPKLNQAYPATEED